MKDPETDFSWEEKSLKTNVVGKKQLVDSERTLFLDSSWSEDYVCRLVSGFTLDEYYDVDSCRNFQLSCREDQVLWDFTVIE